MPSRPDLSFAELDDYVYKTKMSETSISKTSKDIVEKPKTVRPSDPIIEDWDTDSDNDIVFRPKTDQTKPKFTKINFVKSDENVKSVNKENTHKQVEYPRKGQSPREKPVLNNKGRVTGQRENRPVWNNVQRANHQNKLTRPHLKRNFVLTAVATKLGQVPVNAAKQNSLRAAASISTSRPVNTAATKSKVNDALPKTYSYFKAHSPNAVKSSACWIWRPTGNVIDHTSKDSGSYMFKRFDYGNPQYTLQDQGIFDSGCSRHMTGNKSLLTYYQEIDGGFELKFNLFSVSQMCDKKNSVLFTKPKCLVLSPDFKLLEKVKSCSKVPNRTTKGKSNTKPLVRQAWSSYQPTPTNVYIWTNLGPPSIGSINHEYIMLVAQSTIVASQQDTYELIHGIPPSIEFMRLFGCPVTILNTLDPLGKFDGKADEGYGYCKNHKKMIKTGQTRTREWKKCTRAGSPD
ncbi:hypothetical protein Tco_0676918 [Tanacetum coccineum]